VSGASIVCGSPQAVGACTDASKGPCAKTIASTRRGAIRRSADGGTDAVWALSWPEQQAAGINPKVIRAYFGSGFAHPHLQSGTIGDWRLNVFDEEQAATELPTLRAMAAADIHNLVFQLGGDIRVIPATVKGRGG
jgi:hypothetical protein